MWTGVSTTTTIIWDDLLWFVAATWQDDAESEPVVIHRSGRTPANGADDPAAILRQVLAGLELELAD
jgi:hypothetical protein